MRFIITRGDLFQISQSVQKLAPAKPAHAERFRRAVDSIIKRAERINKEHKRECQADVDALPKGEQTQEKIRELREARAKTPIEIDIDPNELQTLAAAYVNFWSLNIAQGSAMGMPYEALNPMAQDLQVLGLWDAWKLGDKLLLPDPDLDEQYPVASLETTPLAEEFPIDALEDKDKSDKASAPDAEA